ncbi:hypothetical protein [Actinophytocola sp.]|uniref:hypothetical protein n=1 Tax=Actinophytocola sp. TaxID=1872138 RepID=UPI003D6A854D
MSEHLIADTTRVLAEVDPDRTGLYRQPHEKGNVLRVLDGLQQPLVEMGIAEPVT